MSKSKKTIVTPTTLVTPTTPVTPLGEDWIKSQLKTLWPRCEVKSVVIGKNFVSARLNFVDGECVCESASGPLCLPHYGLFREGGKLQFVRGDTRALQTLATYYPYLTIADYLNKALPEVPDTIISIWNKSVKELFDTLLIGLKLKRVDLKKEKKRKLREAVKLLTEEDYTVVSPAKTTRGKNAPKDGASNAVKSNSQSQC